MAKEQVKETKRYATGARAVLRLRQEKAWLAAIEELQARAVHTGIKDLAAEHDHYLYGTPKRNART